MLTALRNFGSEIYKNSVFGMTEQASLSVSSGTTGVEQRGAMTLKDDNVGAFFGTPASSSGVPVDHESAQRLSAVWSCVRIMAESMGSLGWDVIRQDKNGNRVKLPQHDVAKLLRNPSPLYKGNIWFETMQAWATMRGNGISIIRRDGGGKPIGLRHVPSGRVKIYYNQDRNVLEYTVHDSRSDRWVTVDHESVIHIRSLVWDVESGWGKSPIEAHRDTIGLGLAGQEYMGSLMKNGAHIPGLLHTEQTVKPEVAKKMGENWREAYGGAGNSGKTPFLHSGVKYQQLNLKPADAQWLEVAKVTTEEVSRIFRVPLHMMSSLERSTNNNIEQQALEFVTNTLRPWVKKWESEMDKLFTVREQGKVFFRFDLNSLLRGDVKTRAMLYNTMLKWGALTIDEVRGLEGFNAVETGEGQVHLYPVNMAPFERLGQFSNDPNGDKKATNEEE